jgi:BMFP domain-containing protein YqiC
MPKACTHRVLRVLVRRPDEKKLKCVKCLKLVHTRHTESLEQRITELSASLNDVAVALYETDKHLNALDLVIREHKDREKVYLQERAERDQERERRWPLTPTSWAQGQLLDMEKEGLASDPSVG